MKQFAIALFAATAAAHHDWIPLMVNYNGSTKTRWLHDKEWSNAESHEKAMRIYGNNSLFLRYEKDLDDLSMIKPAMRGGHFEYDVDLSKQDSGCVAGLYLVDTDNDKDGEFDMGEAPQSMSIDIMQANLYGFETKAHPCTGGECDPVSQCIAGMQQQGVEQYGEGAYGPGGSLINTRKRFHVKTQFLSTRDYKTFWGIRTTLTQYNRKIELEVDCRDYLGGLSPQISAGMGIIFSNWDNRDGAQDFELEQGQSQASSCKDVSHVIEHFHIRTWGSNEGMPPDTSKILIVEDIADCISECNDSKCSQCRNAFWTNSPSESVQVCTERETFIYVNECNEGQTPNYCGSNDVAKGKCFWSYPKSEDNSFTLEDAACRPLPDHLIEGDFKYASEVCADFRGLCSQGCGDGTCHMSWPKHDKAGAASAGAMCRCKPQ